MTRSGALGGLRGLLHGTLLGQGLGAALAGLLQAGDQQLVVLRCLHLALRKPRTAIFRAQLTDTTFWAKT
jgi:hypothetical protein